MTLFEAMKNAEPGNIIRHYCILKNGTIEPDNDEFVVLKGNQLKALKDEYGGIPKENFCDDCWEVI